LARALVCDALSAPTRIRPASRKSAKYLCHLAFADVFIGPEIAFPTEAAERRKTTKSKIHFLREKTYFDQEAYMTLKRLLGSKKAQIMQFPRVQMWRSRLVDVGIAPIAVISTLIPEYIDPKNLYLESFFLNKFVTSHIFWCVPKILHLAIARLNLPPVDDTSSA
jgi:hypothetical protein